MSKEELEPDPICVELLEIRLAIGFKQFEAAEEIGIGASNLSGYERGATSPQLKTVHAWAAVLGKRLALVDDTAGVTKKPSTKKANNPYSADNTVRIDLDRYQVALGMGMLLAAAKDARTDRLAEDLERLADVFAMALGQGR